MAGTAKFITKDFSVGEALFEQGEKGDFVYIIINGAVEVSKETNGKKESVAQLFSGDILGEMAILTDEPRCATAVAIEPTQAIMVNDRTLQLALLNNDLPILKPLTSQLILRFKVAEQQADYYRRKFKELEQEVNTLQKKLEHYELLRDNGEGKARST